MADTDWTFGDTPTTPVAPTKAPDNSHFLSSVIRAIEENPSAAAALATRMGSGWLNTVVNNPVTDASSLGAGMAAGGLVSGAGETLAELLENKGDVSKLDKYRIGTEAALGLVPFAKTFKEGKVLESALRGGLNSALGVGARKSADVLSGTNPNALKEWSPSDAVPILMGSGMGAAFGKYTGAAGEVVNPNAEKYEVETTAVPGGRVLGTKKNKTVIVNQPAPISGLRVEPSTPIISPVEPTGTVPYVGEEPLTPGAAKNKQAEFNAQIQADALAAKLKKQEDAAEAIKNLQLGVEPTVGPVKETISAETPLGKKSVTKTWEDPDADTGSGTGSGDINPDVAQSLREQLAQHLTKAAVPQTTPTSEQIISAISGMAPKDQQAVIAGLRVFDQQAADALEKQIGQKAGAEVPAVAEAKDVEPQISAASQVPEKVPESTVEPSETPTPVPDNTTKITQALLSKQLADLHYTPEQIAAMAPEEAIHTVTNGITAPVTTPLTASIDAASGNVNIPNTLSGADKAQIAAGVIAKAHPKELADQLIPLSQRYNQIVDDIAKIGAPKEGTPAAEQLANLQLEQRTLGMEMRVMTNKAEQSGLIAKGYGKQVSQQINDALEEANASKFGEGTKIEAPATSPVDQKLAELQTNSGINRAQEIAQDPNLNDKEAQDLIDAANKPGGITLGSGLGGGQNILGIIKRNPQLAARLGLGATGALVGANADKDNPLEGALIGGGAGAALPSLAPRLSNMLGASKVINTGTEGVFPYVQKLIPRIEQFSLLADPTKFSGLPLNIFATPLSEAALGGVEHMATGAAERMLPQRVQDLISRIPSRAPIAPSKGVTNALEAGTKLLKTSINPIEWKNRFPGAATRAGTILHGAQEQGGYLPADSPDLLTKWLSSAAQAVGGGHLVASDMAEEAGMSAQTAKQMTNRADPRTQFGQQLAKFTKGDSALAQTLLPFSRTGINVMESSIERSPLYFLFKRLPTAEKVTPAMLVARQGMGGAVGLMSYELGKHIDPQTAQDNNVLKIVSHMAGQYGLIAAGAFAAGQAEQTGKSKATAAGTALTDIVPLADRKTLQEIVTAPLHYASGEPIHPNAEYPFQRWLPNAFVPIPLRDKSLEANPMVNTQNQEWTFK